jgi:glycosyltransferase involved in cell wall biosynthesis
MRFSIVIPAYNGEKYIRLAIESAISQVRNADEIIVVDDASTDNTADIARSSECEGGVKYYYNEPSTGFVDAWNRSIEKSSGDFLTILHQDDLLHPEYLAHAEKAILRYPKVRHIYAACNYINAQGDVIRIPPEPYSLGPVLYSGKQYAHNYLKGVIANNHIHRCPGVTTSRELLINECIYRKEAGHIADDDFFLRVGTFTDVIGISHPLASFREHSDSTTSKVDLLLRQLSRDYVFQVRYNKENSTLLETGDIIKLNKHAVKFINLLLFQSLLYKQHEWTLEALNFSRELDEMLPSSIREYLPFWARKMWAMTSSTGENPTARFYAKILNGLIKGRNLIKSLVVTKC